MTIRLRHGIYETTLADINAVREAVKNGQLRPEDEVWNPLTETWQPLAEAVAGVPSHGDVVSPSAVGPAGPNSPEPERHMLGQLRSRRQIVIIIVVAVLVSGIILALGLTWMIRRNRGSAADQVQKDVARPAAAEPGAAPAGSHDAGAPLAAPAAACRHLRTVVANAQLTRTGAINIVHPLVVPNQEGFIVLWGHRSEGRVRSRDVPDDLSGLTVGAFGDTVRALFALSLPGRASKIEAWRAAAATTGAGLAWFTIGDVTDRVQFAAVDWTGSAQATVATVGEGDGMSVARLQQGGYAVAYVNCLQGDHGDVLVAFVTERGTTTGGAIPLHVKAAPSDSDPASTALGSDGTGLGLAWIGDVERRTGDTAQGGDVLFARLSARGEISGSEVRLTETVVSGREDVQIASASGGFAVAWLERTGEYENARTSVRMRFLGADGKPQRDTMTIASGIIAGYGDGSVALAFSGSDYLVGWEGDRYGQSAVCVALVNGAGVVLESDMCLSSAGADGYGPSIAWDGRGWAVVWVEHREGSGNDVHFARLECE